MRHDCIHVRLFYHLKQALMVMEIFCNLMMYGSTDLLGNGAKNFLCVLYKVYDPNSDTDVEPSSNCEPLVLFNSMFWIGLKKEQKGWNAAWQAAAALGAIGTAIGAITLVVLLRTICFEIRKVSVRKCAMYFPAHIISH